MRTEWQRDGIDIWLESLVHPSVNGRLAVTLRHERFVLTGLAAAFLAIVTLPLVLIAPASPVILGVWSGLVLTPLASAFILSRTGHLDLAQAIHSAVLATFIVLCAGAFDLTPTALALLLLAVPLEASASGSKRGFAAACGSALAASFAGAQATLPEVSQVPAVGAFAVALVVIFAHVVGRLWAESRLEGRAARLRPVIKADAQETLGAIDDLVTWHDRNGEVLRSNGASSKLLSAPSSAIQGSGLFTRVLIGDRPTFLKALSDAARGGATAVAQFRLKADDESGGFIWVEMRVHGVRLSDDLACAAVAVTRDISDHRRYAQERDALRREAVNANDARAELLATVSHELRTPLNAILGYAEILMGRGNLVLLEKRESYAEIIHQSGDHMLGIVNTLLDLSAIEAGHYSLAFEPVRIPALVSECTALIALRAEQAGVSLMAEMPEDVPEIIADRRACRQMLINLLSNAVKFTPRGGEVRIAVRRERSFVTLCVTDTGIGLADEDLSRLGAPFYRGVSRSRGEEAGTGLGLSVVRGLVALHRGSIEIGNTPRQGAMIKISLPIDGVRENAADGDTMTASVPPALPPLSPPSDVLVFKTG